MTKEKNNSGTLKWIGEKFSSGYNILVFIVLIGTGIGNYMVSNYRHDITEEKISKIDERLENVESINHELLLQQLVAIENANKTLTNKIDKTNERVDKVLEILLSK